MNDNECKNLKKAFNTICLRYLEVLEILATKYNHPYTGAYVNELSDLRNSIKADVSEAEGVMAKRPDYVLRKNAQRGAITTWCPECKRKAALRAWNQGRICRYCGYIWTGNHGQHAKLYREWERLRLQK